jgi:acetyl esterase
MERGWTEYLTPDVDRRNPRVSPLYAPDLCGQPPALVITAEFDTLREEGEQYARRLQQAGVPCTLERYDGAIHGFFGMTGISRLSRRALRECGEFLRQWL